MGKNIVLLIPDAYIGNQSGSIVTQVAKNLLIERGFHVSIFSSDIIADNVEPDGTYLFHRIPCGNLSNWNEKEYIKEYLTVLEKSQASTIFTIGSITNKCLCYLEIALEKGLKVISKIFMQDFFCYRWYANDMYAPCSKCLDNNYLEAVKNKCNVNNPVDYIRILINIKIRKRLEKILPKVDYVITSTDEQIEFYVKFGIPRKKCIKTPLFFERKRIAGITTSKGDYFVCIAQNRIEKGFQYLPQILSFCDNSIKIIVAYNNKKQAEIAISKFGFQPYIDKGLLEIKHNMQWDSGLSQLIANSRGIIIPSIWPTTTEYGLLEALGLKKPVFTFEVGIHREKLINYENGFVAPIGDCEKMATQIMAVNSNNTLYDKVSINGFSLYNELTNKNYWLETLSLIGL